MGPLPTSTPTALDDGSERLVWYASYGSNLCAARFSVYLTGGTPVGSARTYEGARDVRPARADRALTLGYPLYFAGESKVWGGSPAFIDTVVDPARISYARAYLITWEQFEDVVAQENHRERGVLDIADSDLVDGYTVAVGPGRYENLLCVDRLDGVPVVTFTSPWSMASVEPGPPVGAYLSMLIAGLREAHDLNHDALVAYLGAAPGCSPGLVEAVLAGERRGTWVVAEEGQ